MIPNQQPQQRPRILTQALTRIGGKWEYARLLNAQLERTGSAEDFDSALNAITGLGEEISALSEGSPAEGTRIIVSIEIHAPESVTGKA